MPAVDFRRGSSWCFFLDLFGSPNHSNSVIFDEWKPMGWGFPRSILQDKDAWGPLFNKTSRPRDDDETVESLWSDWDIPRRMMQALSWGMQC
jgi:hypothetical protein